MLVEDIVIPLPFIIDENSSLVSEKLTISSWIRDLTNNRKKKVVTMTLNNGRKYVIYDMTRYKFDQWHRSPSRGKFWHKYVKGYHLVEPIG